MTSDTRAGARIGYARVSKGEQLLDLQMDALNATGCARIFTDHVSGAKDERPGLTATLDYLRAGDTLVVWKLDRLSRSLRHLIDTVAELERRGVAFMSLTQQIDTASPGGKLFFHVFGALAEFERDQIRERTMAGLAAARARGRKGGRPPALSEIERAKARQLRDQGIAPADLAQMFRCSMRSIYRALERSA